MKANNSQIGFDKTKISFHSKSKKALSEINQINLRETLSVFSFTNNLEKNNPKMSIKLGEKDEYGFPSIKTIQKDLINNIYSKESGEIINVVKKVNEDLRNLKSNIKNEEYSSPIFKKIIANGNSIKVPKSQFTCLYDSTSSNFFSKINYTNRESNEDCKTEIVSIRKKNPSENVILRKKNLINEVNLKNSNSNLSYFNNEKYEKRIKKENCESPDDSNFRESQKLFWNKRKNNYDSSINSFLTPMIHTKEKFENKNNSSIINNNANSDEKSFYVTQSVKNNNLLPENLKRKFNITTKNSLNSWNAINKIFNKRNQGFYCPHCEHCNNIKDENLEEYIGMKEAKNVIKKSFDYICEYYDNDQSFLDFLIDIKPGFNSINNNNSNNNIVPINNNNLIAKNNNDNNKNSEVNNKNDFYNTLIKTNSLIKNFKKENSCGSITNRELIHKNSEANNNNNITRNKSLSTTLMNDLSNNHYPKNINSKNYNLNVCNGELENLKNNKKNSKFDMDNLLLTYPKITNDRNILQLVTHFLDALVNDKIALERIVTPEIIEKLKESLIAQGLAFKANENELDFDKEICMLFDETTREKIKKLFKTKFKQMKDIENERKQKQEEELVEIRKRFMLLFIIFIQLISEVGAECKEKAVLLYRVFKMFFAEQERKWANLTYKIKEKIGYYKELCKTLIETKNNDNTKVDKINDILFSRRVTEQNLNDHKELIYNLIHLLNEKRDNTYLLKSDIDILNKELNYFVFGFDKIKLDPKIRDKIKEIDPQELLKNINEELAHKQVSELEKMLLINSDIYSIISGHRNYFYEQKQYYSGEIKRINELHQKVMYKKKKYKKELMEISSNFDLERQRLEKEIQYFRDKICSDKVDTSIQTEVDSMVYNKFLRNHRLIEFQKSLDQNKLYNYIEKIRFHCSKEKPISKKSLLTFIPELYNEKIRNDSLNDIESFNRLTLDQFFIKFFREKFKFTKIFKKNCEQTILAILKYSSEDNRIDLLRRFLGIGDAKIQREILDCYLNLLKNLPMSFYKVFEETETPYVINLDECFDLYREKFNNYYLSLKTMDKLVRECEVYEGDKKIENLTYEKIRDKFLLNRFYFKNGALIETLLEEYQKKIKSEIDVLYLANQFILTNREFELDLNLTLEILKENFKININNQIELDSFFAYYLTKCYFKIKIIDFVNISVERFINIYTGLSKILSRLWDKANIKREGIIFYKDYEYALLGIFGNSGNKWKLGDYFKTACGSNDKDFINKNEFITSCLNIHDILIILLNQRKTLKRSLD